MKRSMITMRAARDPSDSSVMHARRSRSRLRCWSPASSPTPRSSLRWPGIAYTDPDGSGYRVGVSGWTIEGQWNERRSPMHSLLLAAELTPMNAHNSNRAYEDGERREDLDYDNASYRVGGGVRLSPWRQDTQLDILLVGLYESVERAFRERHEAMGETVRRSRRHLRLPRCARCTASASPRSTESSCPSAAKDSSARTTGPGSRQSTVGQDTRVASICARAPRPCSEPRMTS